MILGVAALLTHGAGCRAELGLVAIWCAAWAGTTLPDIDLMLGLAHRNVLTHSLIPALPALASARWRPVGIGLLWGMGLHLAADTYPNGMRGLATVKVPGSGSIGAAASYGWLAANALTGLVGGAWLAARSLRDLGVRPILMVATAAGLIALGAAYLLRTDGGWWALAALCALTWLALRR